MSIRTTINEHEVRYDEAGDKWECYALKLSSTSLKALRAKINKVDADARRIDNVPLVNLDSWGKQEPVEGVLIEGDSVWVLRKVGNKTERQKVRMESLALAADADGALVEWSAVCAERDALAAKARNLYDAIPRVTAEVLFECLKDREPVE